MSETNSDTILATVTPSATRRVTGVATLLLLGAMEVYIALSRPPESLSWQVFLLGLGGFTLLLADVLRRATARRLELTETELRDSTGICVARVDRIQRVDRGTFAAKPSNGFSLLLSTPETGGNYWAPGLWWRLGRRVGVGGIASAGETKALAEFLMVLTAKGDNPDT